MRIPNSSSSSARRCLRYLLGLGLHPQREITAQLLADGPSFPRLMASPAALELGASCSPRERFGTLKALDLLERCRNCPRGFRLLSSRSACSVQC